MFWFFNSVVHPKNGLKFNDTYTRPIKICSFPWKHLTQFRNILPTIAINNFFSFCAFTGNNIIKAIFSCSWKRTVLALEGRFISFYVLFRQMNETFCWFARGFAEKMGGRVSRPRHPVSIPRWIFCDFYFIRQKAFYILPHFSEVAGLFV